jgi:phosphopantothenoylcysteine synthetase/decarboxylase
LRELGSAPRREEADVPRFKMTYLLVTGAANARMVPDLIARLAPVAEQLLTVLTPNAGQIVSRRELALVPGHRIVESYFDDAILPRPPEGVTLVAPCSFNSLNKLAQGVADNLPLSIAAEAIGRGTPVIVAVAVNAPLWAHPRAAESVRALRGWGVTVLDPVAYDGGMGMAPLDAIVAVVVAALER